MEARRREELERLYRRHRAEIHRYLARRVGNREDADDVVQDAFLNALRAIDRGARPDNPRSWLFAIAENAHRRRLRRGLRTRALTDAVAIAAPQPETTAQDLVSALRTLPPAQLEAVVLREFAGLSYDEVARRAGTSTSSVQMLLFRARRTLRDALSVFVPLGRVLDRLGTAAQSPVTALAARAAGAAAILLIAGGAVTGAGPADATRRPVARDQPLPAQASHSAPTRGLVVQRGPVSASAAARPARTRPAPAASPVHARPAATPTETAAAAAATAPAAPTAASPAAAEPSPTGPDSSAATPAQTTTSAAVPALPAPPPVPAVPVVPPAPPLPPVPQLPPAPDVPQAPQVPALPPLPAVGG